MARNSTPTEITVRTNFTPDISFDPLAPKPAGDDIADLSKTVLRFVKPSFDIQVPGLGRKHYAPYGEPTQAGLIVSVIVLGLAAYGLWRLLK